MAAPKEIPMLVDAGHADCCALRMSGPLCTCGWETWIGNPNVAAQEIKEEYHKGEVAESGR